MSSTDIRMNGNRVSLVQSNENAYYYFIIFQSGHGVRNTIKVNEKVLNDLQEKIKKVREEK